MCRKFRINARTILSLITLFLLPSCGINSQNLQMSLANESAISSKSGNIYLNGEELGYFDGVVVSAGEQIVSFTGSRTLQKRQYGVPREESFNGACVLFLPFCLLGNVTGAMNIYGTENRTSYVDAFCNGRLSFISEKGKEYSVSLKESVNKPPELIVEELNKNWNTIKNQELNCREVE